MKKFIVQDGIAIYQFNDEERKLIAEGASFAINGLFFEIGMLDDSKTEVVLEQMMHETDNWYLNSKPLEL